MTQKEALLIKRTQTETLMDCARFNIKEAADNIHRTKFSKEKAELEYLEKIRQDLLKMFYELCYMINNIHDLKLEVEDD